MSRHQDYNDAREELARAKAALDALEVAVAAGVASAVSSVEVVRLRIELGVAYTRLAAVR